jgi:hypothetical protein
MKEILIVKLFAATLAACLLCATQGADAAAAAQSRTRRAPTQRRTTPQRTQPRTTLSQTEANAARIKLSDEIKKLARFVYLYGRISKDLETVSAQPQSAEVARRTKAALLTNFAPLRDDLDQLERQFRFTRGLEGSYQKLQGAAQRMAEAESQVSAGQYDRAGKLLVDIVTQLTDVLLEM